jgi:hypothetical protein
LFPVSVVVVPGLWARHGTRATGPVWCDRRAEGLNGERVLAVKAKGKNQKAKGKRQKARSVQKNVADRQDLGAYGRAAPPSAPHSICPRHDARSTVRSSAASITLGSAATESRREVRVTAV